MTRIIAGEFGGRTLAVPARGTRPTTDRVREAVFSRLEHLGVLPDAVALDLFAGSGALGLEAVSRGAARVTLVESAAGAVATLRKNVAALKVGDRARVARSAVLTYLKAAGDDVDLVFLDPPYDLADEDMLEVLTALVPHLKPEAYVVVEWPSRRDVPWPAQLRPEAAKTYGETAIHYVALASKEGSVEP